MKPNTKNHLTAKLGNTATDCPDSKLNKPSIATDVAADIAAIAIKIVREIIPQNPNGFTFDPRCGRCLSLGRNTNSNIYVASIAGHELRLDCQPTALQVLGWLVTAAELLMQERMFIGFWVFADKYYLDISVLISGKAKALNFARANDQQAIFHPASGQSIPVLNSESTGFRIHDKLLEPVFGK